MNERRIDPKDRVWAAAAVRRLLVRLIKRIEAGDFIPDDPKGRRR